MGYAGIHALHKGGKREGSVLLIKADSCLFLTLLYLTFISGAGKIDTSTI